MAEVAVILLGAGLSSRMGADNKLLLPFRGRTIWQTTLDQILAANVGPVILVTSEVSIETIRPQVPEGVQLVENPHYQTGMTSSIQVGVEAAGAVDGYLICLADQPLIQAETYQGIVQVFADRLSVDSQVIALPYFEQQKGNPVLFSSAYRAAILAHTEPEGCKGIVQQNRFHVLRFETGDSGILRDVDTPEDFDGLKDHQ